MNNTTSKLNDEPKWFAIRTRHAARAEQILRPLCNDVFYPTETRIIDAKKRTKALIPNVLFINTTADNALTLEAQSRQHINIGITFWIYRYPADNRIQEISQSSINLLQLITAGDTTHCEIFNKKDFKENEHVRIIGGPYCGFEGYVQRVKKNKHVIVKIEGICLILLPFIHPDLLQKIPDFSNNSV